jgi:hypothetical protein
MSENILLSVAGDLLSEMRVIAQHGDYFEVQEETELEYRMMELLNRKCGIEKNFSKGLLPVIRSALFCFHMLVLALPALAQPFQIPRLLQIFLI